MAGTVPLLFLTGVTCLVARSQSPFSAKRDGTRGEVMKTLLAPAVIVCVLASFAHGAVIGEPKRPYQDREDDRPCVHDEVITGSGHEYVVEFWGTIDGTMTRMPVGYAAFVQGWQPNRALVIENIGRTDVHNPRVVVNRQGDWRTLGTIVDEATRGWTTPADRARAIWEFVRRRRFHACTWDNECSDALKALNVYGYTLCGNQARVITDLWKTAGLKTRRCYPIGHCVSEVFYEGQFHLLDSDEHVICLMRDNHTVASAEAIVRDHDLVKRTHTYGIGRADGRQTDEFSASLYVHEGPRQGDYDLATSHLMGLTLRPGESIEFRWDHIGKQYTSGLPLEEGQRKRDGLGDLLAGWGPTAYDNLRNGKLRYRPDLCSPLAPCGAERVAGVTFDTGTGQLRPGQVGEPGRVTWRFASPYVFVGGRAFATIELGEDATAQWRYSADGETWTSVASAGESDREELTACLDEVLSPRGKPTYGFRLQLSLGGQAAAREVVFDHDIQTATLNLPELTVGENHVVYSDDSPGERKVRVTHRWLERTARHRPAAPAEAVLPADGATVEGTAITFAWQEPADPDGDAVVDYHFELSAHADMRWPLSPNFEKRISHTPSRGKPQWTVPYVGLLNPDTSYFWRVRALDASGVWGPWSRTFRFQARAPGVPLDVQLAPHGEGGLTLSWRPNPQGRPPVVYKVYASDEKGFTVNDSDHLVFRGKGFVRTMEEFQNKPSDAPDAGLVKTPGNLVTQTSETQLRVVGPEVTLPNTNKAFYRVVAVDACGNESGPSDYAEVTRPFVYTRPQPAKVHVAYEYQPQSIRSIGDLRCRRSEDSSYNAAFWDREESAFQAVRLPDGWTLDPHSGRIAGTPDHAGVLEIAFEVSAGPANRAIVRQQIHVR
jgi:hypothetical protein